VFTVAFPAVTARYFRLTVLTTPAPREIHRRPCAPRSHSRNLVSELVLHTEHRHQPLSGQGRFFGHRRALRLATPQGTGAIAKADVVDLTSRMRPDGSLDWTPSPGHWVVLRFGYS
jgi:hypothetical protein